MRFFVYSVPGFCFYHFLPNISIIIIISLPKSVSFTRRKNVQIICHKIASQCPPSLRYERKLKPYGNLTLQKMAATSEGACNYLGIFVNNRNVTSMTYADVEHVVVVRADFRVFRYLSKFKTYSFRG